MFEPGVENAAADLVAWCTERDLTLATAESCTGGLVAAALTEISGSSAVFDRGFVTYSNEAKSDLLGVAPGLIESRGAVSAEIAAAMVQGTLERTEADCAVAVTGIAGPTGGTAEKPVGLVYLCAMRRGGLTLPLKRLFGNEGRQAVRGAALRDALALLTEVCRG